MLDVEALGTVVAGIVADEVRRATTPLIQSNEALARRLGDMEARAAIGPDAVAAMIADSVADMPPSRDGGSLTVSDVEPLIAAAVARAVAGLPIPADGKDADPEVIAAMIADALAALPPPKDGDSVTVADVEPMIAGLVERAVGGLPRPADGKDVDPEAVRAMIADAVAALPRPADGKSVTVADVEPLVASLVEQAVAALPVPKDGRGLAGALIDRTGSLVVTLTDGALVDLGRVEGRPGDDGLGFDDLTVDRDGDRGFVLRFSRGEQEKTFSFKMPVLLDRGVYRAGQAYEEGDCVTFGGSLWIAQRATEEKPDGEDTGWRLGVKRGRDGRGAESRA